MARKADSITKVCTKSGETFTGTRDEIAEFFYRDKSQKDGFSPWSKAAERAYNKAYREGLKQAEVARKADADDEGVAVFEVVMAPERVARKKGAGTVSKREAATKAAAKKAPTKKATTTAKGKGKAASVTTTTKRPRRRQAVKA